MSATPYTNECKMCGCKFKSKSEWRAFCDNCRDIRHREVVQKSRGYLPKKSKKKEPLTTEQIAEKAKATQIAEVERRQKKYCAGYDATNWECVSCYENQVRQFKGCRK